MSVPKNIYQTHKSLEYISNKPKLFSAVNSWKKYENEFTYNFYDDTMCEEFIKNNFEEKIYTAYSMLPMAVMKADLWRYCIIYMYGGIYADVDAYCNVNPNMFINNSYLTISPESCSNFFCQWTFAAPPKSPILKSIIDLSVERILTTEIKGEHIIHHLTGPAVFTTGIINYLKNTNACISDEVINYIGLNNENLYVFEPEYFHKNIIIHFFAGSDDDGWKNERYKIIQL